jgi:hypothetical protein
LEVREVLVEVVVIVPLPEMEEMPPLVQVVEEVVRELLVEVEEEGETDS